ncbi:MAG: ferritin family protein [Rhodospirillaceae bacterium]|nr:ferritin family protein [Rhodospirillales bacterium]
MINPLYPIPEISSVDELMAIAVGMEHEAASRYDDLAQAMDNCGETELAALFRHMAELEREHEAGLSRWADREGRPAPLPMTYAWHLPETFGDEAEGAQAHTLTPYNALGIAVRNEERAFTFYSYLAALAEDDTTRLRAEALAREELKHVHQLRMLRRRAFHMEREAPRAFRRARDTTELARLAHGLEHAAAGLDDAMAAVLEAAGASAAAVLLCQQADAARLRAMRFSGARPSAGSRAAEGARASGLLEPGALTADGALKLSLRNAEEIAEAYMATAEHALDGQLMHEAQELAEAAVARLAVVRSLIDDGGKRA